MISVLHVASECYPLAKTGGLGDVVGALPAAQRQLGLDARIALPAYRDLAARLGARPITELWLRGHGWTVMEATLDVAGTAVPLYLFHCPPLLDRAGDPYRDPQGRDFADNGARFGGFCEAVAQFLWLWNTPFRPQLVHLHDWQSGPLAAWLRCREGRPRLLFTIHNLAYQGVFARSVFDASGLPDWFWHADGVEFWGRYSFMKAGLALSDAISTVSPSYAREIQHADYGCGMDGLLRARAEQLHGIVNGIDDRAWDPQTDPLIDAHYDHDSARAGKRANKEALCQRLGLDASRPLIGFIGRLAEQKGVDLIIDAWPQLLHEHASYVIVASGDPALEARLRQLQQQAPAGKLATCIVHSEPLAHQVTAAADLLLMPSRYEPCGLNQLYAQRYGTLPVVRRTGGLADTVVDATAASLLDGSATGVQFNDADVNGLCYGVRRGLELCADPQLLERMRRRGMQTDWSWTASASSYVALYQQLLQR